ncbi:hypothetical protein BV898_14461 [Hypsibius exemplaris]|uniref:Uncharacterized protein n=1 Tax=Hypsibius exemplaris TaxID=2072580 RepID=A0A9X6RJI3_HYPEX|nr:hypothetical protein BV898_14461 [Hypsibius exemplaris]
MREFVRAEKLRGSLYTVKHLHPPPDRPNVWTLFSRLRFNKIIHFLTFLTYCTTITTLARLATQPNRVYRRPTPRSDGISPVLQLHYVWVENRRSAYPRDLTALQYLSILSALTILRPDLINLHTNAQFQGPLWSAVESHVTVRPIHRFTSARPPLKHIEHEADIIKLQVAYDLGGVLVDFDVYFTGHREEYLQLFRTYQCVFAQFHSHNRTFLAIGNFGCRARSPFIEEVLREYRDNFRGYKCYDPGDPIPFLYNGCLYPYLLWRREAKFRESVKVETTLLPLYPRKDVFLFQSGKINWDRAFNVHSGYEGPDVSLSEVCTWNSTFGDVLRHIVAQNIHRLPVKMTANYDVREPPGMTLIFTRDRETNVKFPFDLTTLEFLVLWSAVERSGARRVELHGTSDTVRGPYVEYLVEKARKQAVLLHVINHQRKGVPQGSSTVPHSQGVPPLGSPTVLHFDLKTFFMKPILKNMFSLCPGGSLNLLEDCRMPNDSAVLELNRTHLKPTGHYNWNDYTFVTTRSLRGPMKDVTLESIRKERSPFAALLRLVYYGTVDVIKDRRVHHYPCGT